jgi:transposase
MPAARRQTCREILELERALWTFAYVEGVEPTNNVGEHRIRHGVMWRKTSLGAVPGLHG